MTEHQVDLDHRRTAPKYAENLPATIVEQSREDATESAAQQFDLNGYMRAGRTCDGIFRALERALDVDLHELPPLYTAIECDALEQLFRPQHEGRPRPDVSVTFSYDTYTITLTADGCLTIEE